MRRTPDPLVLAMLIATCAVPAAPARADWPAGGLKVASSVARDTSTAYADGMGGVLVYAPEVQASEPRHIFTRVRGDGTIPSGWPTTALAIEPGFFGYVLGHANDVFYVDVPDRSGFRVRRLLLDGALDPTWPAGGLLVGGPEGIDAPTFEGGDYGPWGVTCAMAADGAGGLYLFWTRSDSIAMRRARVLPNGAYAPGWEPTAATLELPAVQSFAGNGVTKLSVGADTGAISGYVNYWNYPLNDPFYDSVPYRLLLDPSTGALLGGAPQAQAATDARAATSMNVTSLTEEEPQDVPDGLGGRLHFYMVGTGIHGGGIQLRMTHLLADGSIAPGWPEIGYRILVASTQGIPHFTAVTDNNGGAFIVREDMNGTVNSHPDVYVLAVSAQGLPTTAAPPAASPRAGALSARPIPAHGRVSVDLAVPEPAQASVDVFDLAGRRVRGLFDGELPAGRRTFDWDGTDAAGASARSGVYLVRARLGGHEYTQRVVLR